MKNSKFFLTTLFAAAAMGSTVSAAWDAGFDDETGIPLTTDFASASVPAGSGQQSVDCNTIFTYTSAGNVGASGSDGFNTNGYDVKLVAAETAMMTINGNFLGSGDIWFAQGRWLSNAADRLTALGGIYAIGGQVWFQGAAQTLTSDVVVGQSTFHEEIGSLDYSSLRVSHDATLTGTVTVLAEGTKFSFQDSHTLTIGTLIGSGNITTGRYNGANSLVIVKAQDFTGNIAIVDGVSLIWGAKSTDGEGTAYPSAAVGSDGVAHNISGSGEISSTSGVLYNYTGSAGAAALGVDNASITASSIEFRGGATYQVSSDLYGKNAAAADNSLVISEGKATFTGSVVKKFGTVSVAEDAEAVFVVAPDFDIANSSFVGGGSVTFDGQGQSLTLGGTKNLGGLAFTNGGTFALAGTTTLSDGALLSVSNSDLTVSGTYSAENANISLAGGSLKFTTALKGKTLSVTDGAFTSEGTAELTKSLTVTGAGSTAELKGALNTPTLNVASGATVTIHAMAARSQNTISVSNATLVFVNEDVTRTLNAQFAVTLDDEGEISGLCLENAGLSTFDARSGTLDAVQLNTGNVTLVLYADETGAASDDPAASLADRSLNGDDANVLLTRGFSINSDAHIDFSNLVFQKAGDTYALFEIGDGTDGASVLTQLSQLRDLGGSFSLEDDVIYFTANSSMQFVLPWDATLDNKIWEAGSFQGTRYENLDQREIFFGKISTGDEERVAIGEGAAAKRLSVQAGTTQTYVVESSLADPNFSVGTLSVRRGTLDLRTKMTVADSVVVSGGTLIANASGALTLSDSGADTISVNAGGTLRLNTANAATAGELDLVGGARLELVNGGLAGVDSIVLSGTTEDRRAEIVWLEGDTVSIANKVSLDVAGTTPYVDLIVESGSARWGVSGLSSAGADVRKLGAGTLYLEQTGSFNVGTTLRVEEGVLQLGSTGQKNRIFGGTLTVADGALLYLHGVDSFGVLNYDSSVSVVLEDGAAMYLNGGSVADVQTLNNVQLTLGDGTKIASSNTAPVPLEGSTSAANTQGIRLGANTTVSVDDNAHASIDVLVQLATTAAEFAVGDGATLTLSKGVINSNYYSSDPNNPPEISGGILKTGAGTLTISTSTTSSDPVYAGETDIREGTLKLSGKAAPGTGEVKVAAGATFEIALSKGTTATISGGLSGDGSLVVSSGTAAFTDDAEIGDATVASGAELNLATYGVEFSGNLTLYGTFSGSGYAAIYKEGTVTFGEGAALKSTGHLLFNAEVSTDSEKALTKTGSGYVFFGEDTDLTGFALTLNGGAVASAGEQSVARLEFDGGVVCSYDVGGYSYTGEWTTEAISVGTKGGIIGADVTLTTTAGQASIVLGGDLEISGENADDGTGIVSSFYEEGSLVVDGTLNLSSTGGSLIIGTSYTTKSDIDAGGLLKATTLNVAASLKSIEMGTFEDPEEDEGEGEGEGETAAAWPTTFSEIIADRISFAGATTLTGKAGAIRVGDEISFADKANVVLDGTLFTIDPEFDSYADAVAAGRTGEELSATVNVQTKATTVTVGRLIGDLEKTGAGSLNIKDFSFQSTKNLSVNEGTLRLTFSTEVDAKRLMDGKLEVSGATLQVSDTVYAYRSSVSLTDGATLQGSLDLYTGTEAKLTDSRITGSLRLFNSSLGANTSSEAEVDNLKVGYLRLIGDDWKLKLTGTSPAIQVENTLYVNVLGAQSFAGAFSKDNFELDYSSIGSEYTIIKVLNESPYYPSLYVNGIDHPYEDELDDNKRVLIGGLFRAGETDNRDYQLVWDETSSSLKVLAYGTKVWDGTTNIWTEGGTGWNTISSGGTQPGEFLRNDYAEFNFSGLSGEIAVSGAVHVGGVVFSGATSGAEFTVNFTEGSYIGDCVTNETTGDTRASTITVLSGKVIFHGSENISDDDASKMYSRLTIAAGASVTTDGAKALGTETVTLGGELIFSGRDDTLGSAVVTTGSQAKLTVSTGLVVTLAGELSGTSLTKAGEGTLRIAGETDLDGLTIGGGKVVVGSGEADAASIVLDAGRIEITTGAQTEALTFENNASLAPDAQLVVAEKKNVVFKGSSSLNFVEFTGVNANVGFAEGVAGEWFTVGGYEVETDENDQPISTTPIVAEYTLTSIRTGTSTIKGDLIFSGHREGENVAGLFVTVSEGSTLKIDGVIVDGGEDAGDMGEFVLGKTGAGTFEITGEVSTGAELQLNGGAVKIGGEADLTGNVLVGSDSTLALAGGTLGAADSSIVVNSAATFTLTGTETTLVNAELSVAGTLKVGGKVTFGGADNKFNLLEIDSNAEVGVGAGVSGFTGNQVKLGGGATLSVEAQLAESSGVLAVNANGSKIVLGDGEGNAGVITFSYISGTNSQSQVLKISGEGEVRLVGGIVTSAMTLELSDETASLVFDTDSSAETSLLRGTGSLVKRGEGELLVRQTTPQYFTGTVSAEAGKIVVSGSGSLGQAKLSVAEGAEIVVKRADAKIGSALVVNAGNGYVAGSLAGGEGKLIVEGAGNSLTFTSRGVISSDFEGIIGARDGGRLIFNEYISDGFRELLLENGTLAVAEGDSVAGALELSGTGNVIDVAGKLEIGGVVIGDVKGTTAVTVSGAGALTFGGVGRVDGIDAELDVYTATDFEGTLTLKYLADDVLDPAILSTQHRNTYVNAGTVVIDGDARAAGSGTIKLAGGTAALRFTDLGTGADAQKITTPIVGAGKVQGDSGVLVGLSENFVGSVVATGAGTFTMDKSGAESLSVGAVAFSAEAGATLVVELDGDGASPDVSEVDMGSATFASGGGVIKLNIGADRTLNVDTASADFRGDIEVASGTLVLTSDGDLGSADVTLAAGTVMNVVAKIFKGSVSGAGDLVKDTTGSSFVRSVGARTTVDAGTLALEEVSQGTEIYVGNATLEFAKQLDDSGALVNRRKGDTAEFDAALTGGSGMNVRFSHDSATGSTVVRGSFDWDGAAGTLMFIGGGEGSVFNPQIIDGKIVKSGSGKWTLANTEADQASISVEANGGTLALRNYCGYDAQTLSVGSGGVLEIAGYSSNSDGSIRGVITGAGTLAISAEGETRLALDAASGTAWKLQILAGATVKRGADEASNVFSKNVEIGSAPDDASQGGVLEINGDQTLSGKISVYGLNKDPDGVGNGRLTASGGTLDLTGAKFLLGGVLDVRDDATVQVKTIDSQSSRTGVVKLASSAVLEIGSADVENGALAALSGTGTVKFVAGKTYVKNVNGTETMDEFNAGFAGKVEIWQGATAVISSEATFGKNVSEVKILGTLRVEQGNSTYTLKNLVGEGRLEIANTKATVRTTYDADNASFTGTIDVQCGRLVMKTTTFDAATPSEIRLSGGANAGLVLSNAAATTELSGLADKNVTGTGTVYLENGEFTIAKDKAFGYAKTLDVTAGTTLALGSGATVTSGLYVEKGATLDLTRELAPVSGGGISLAAAVYADDPVPAPAAPAQAQRLVQGDFTLAGTMLVNVVGSDAPVRATGNASVLDTADVTLDGDLSGSVVVVSAGGRTLIAPNATFRDGSGVVLAAWVGDDGTSIYVSEMAPESEIVPSGMETLYATLASKPNSSIFRAIRGSGTNAEQTAKLRNFSPVSFAGILELSTGLAQFEDDLLRQRLEQRRYDRAYGEAAGTLKAFVNAIGGTGETSEGKDKRPNYDLSHYGAVAGFDTLISEDFLVGASITIDKGKAKIHNGGGKHETDAARLGFYGMAMLDEVSYFGFGAGVGTFSADTKRSNALESLSGDASGTDVSLTATLGRMFVISSELGLHVSPYVGLDYTYSNLGSFKETGGSQSALDVDGADRSSLRGTVGATLNWLPSESWRFSLEAAYHHEFLDTDADVDAKFASGDYRGMDASATAYFGGENSLSVGPRVEYRINAEWSVSAGYTFETDFKDTTTHSANVGVRCRF
ncbi:MAG: hypothetical protein ACI4QA_01010 [Candidatus Spyradosoma sp.]